MRRLLPLIALLLPAPALADVTATYTAGKGIFAVEVDDGGDARAGVDGKFVLIRRDGVDYIVIYTPDGAPHVTRAGTALEHFIAKASTPDKWRTELSNEGDATVAGYPGSVWRFGPEGDRPLELVMSADPALAPVGQVFTRIAEAFAQFIDTRVGPTGNAGTGVHSLFSHGTPIRISETAVEPAPGRVMIELRSVSHAEIDAHRFDLPGPVMDTEAFFAAVQPPSPPISDEPMIIPDTSTDPAQAPKKSD